MTDHLPPPPPARPDQAPGKKPIWKRGWFLVAAAALVALTAIGALGGRSEQNATEQDVRVSSSVPSTTIETTSASSVASSSPEAVAACSLFRDNYDAYQDGNVGDDQWRETMLEAQSIVKGFNVASELGAQLEAGMISQGEYEQQLNASAYVQRISETPVVDAIDTLATGLAPRAGTPEFGAAASAMFDACRDVRP